MSPTFLSAEKSHFARSSSKFDVTVDFETATPMFTNKDMVLQFSLSPTKKQEEQPEECNYFEFKRLWDDTLGVSATVTINVEEIIIPEEYGGYKVSTIFANGFKEQTNLKSVIIPSSVKKIESGAFAGCILGALFILVDNPMQAVWFVAMFLVLQQIENNLIYPRVVGTSIGLPGMWVLVAVSVGGEIMGVAGMFLMIPMVAVLYVILREVTNHRLEGRAVCADKLEAQPPELISHLKPKRKKKYKKQAPASEEKSE